MKIVPHNNYILCRQLTPLYDVNCIGNFQFKRENMPIYEIIDVPSISDNLRYTSGDLIISNSTGTKITLESDVLYLIDVKTIIGKIEKEINNGN